MELSISPGFVCLEFDTLLITTVSWWYHTQEQIRVYAVMLIQIHCFSRIGLYTFRLGFFYKTKTKIKNFVVAWFKIGEEKKSRVI